MDNAKLKAQAKARLKGNWQVLIVSILLFILLGGCCSFIATAVGASWLSSLITLIVDALIAMGFVGMILNVARKKPVKFEDLFEETNLFNKYLVITIILIAIGFVMSLIEYLAFGSLLMVLYHQAAINTFLEVILVIFGLFLNAAIIMVNLYVGITLSQTYFILYDEPKLSIGATLMKSFDMMADYVIEYFILVLSFIGWFILGLFTLGILYIWLFPYFAVTLALFYDKIKKEYEATTGDYEMLEQAETVKTPAPKKTTPKKSTAKKPATKQSTTKKVATKKTATAKKAATTKTVKKSTPRKTTKPKTTK